MKLSHPTRESARIKEKKERLVASVTDLSAEQKYANFLAALEPAVE